MNVSATLNTFKLLVRPSLCIPHATVSTFDQLPIPISKALAAANGGKRPDVRALVLDKDNCFAKPKENAIYEPYVNHFQILRNAYPDTGILIVSNSAGTNDDSTGDEARALERSTGVQVFRHSRKKPGCGLDVFNYLTKNSLTGLNQPSQIAVIGDRLFTDVMMANMTGAWSIWVRDGVVRNDGAFSRLEKAIPLNLDRLGFKAITPLHH